MKLHKIEMNMRILGIVGILGMAMVFLSGCGVNPEDAALEGFRQRGPQDPIATIVGSQEYNFGTAQIGDEGSHVFEIRNDGQSPLTLEPINLDESGVVARVEGSPVAPGGTASLIVDWTINYYEENYLQNVGVETNDPEMDMLSLRLMGNIPPAVRPQQSRLGFRNVRASEGFESYFDIYAYFDNDLEVLSHEWLDPETESFMEVRYETLPPDHASLEDQEDVQSAVRIWVRALPGMPAGVLREAITVKTNKETRRPIQVGVLADVRGAFAVEAGQGLEYDSEINVVDLGRISRLSKKDATLNVSVNLTEIEGEEVTLKVEQIEPAGVLQVDVGETRKVGKGMLIPVRLMLQGNGQSISRMGPGEDLLGRVRLVAEETKDQCVEFYVKFAITQ
ncbi:MAG: DUF1573 domain-containing protein [Planctomycetota bacterium]|nr:DUF1573 domain-containing protein [Planctomycetota bacterium]